MGYYRTGVVSFVRGRPLPQMGYKPRRPNRSGYKKPKTSAPRRAGNRVRRAGRIATQQRRKRPVNRVSKTGDNSSFSYTMMKARWNPSLRSLFRLVQGRQTRFGQLSSSALSGTGTQSHIQLLYLTVSDLTSITTACNDNVSTSNAVRCFIGSIKQRCSFKNQSNAVGKLMIYDLVCKRHPPTGSLDTPVEAWNKGMTDFGITASQNIGNTPNMSPEFRQYWFIRKVTTVMVEPGQQHDHVVNRSINKVYDSTYWSNLSSNSAAWLTGVTLCVFHGSLAHESATPTTVTTNDMRVDYAATTEINFGYIKQNVPSHTVTAVLPTSLVDPDFMGEAGDVDANVVNA